MTTTWLGLVALMACGQEQKVDPVTPVEPAEKTAKAVKPPEVAPDKKDIVAPAWGDGSTEYRVDGELMGVTWVGPAPGVPGKFIEASVLFLDVLTADAAKQWDPNLHSLAKYPYLAPIKGDGALTTGVDANDMVRCKKKNDCTTCDDPATGAVCYATFDDFKNGVWGDLAKRLGRTVAEVKDNTAHQLVETMPWDRGAFTLAACNPPPTVTEYSPPRNNVIEKASSPVAYLHMGQRPNNRAMVRVVVPLAEAAFPDDYQLTAGAPGTGGPYDVAAWCAELDGWCTQGLNCQLSVQELFYPQSW